ncbi:Hypothetical predicted protein [Olea europaea subsp. europaea]|uniref:Uncharacterized protein n=1 Tax=Olea europaea subsp. europaea TaxID=158383 RepID=A0A8S0U8C3_OLEEU|nr:Hypothetical predicted protein [Olea europaea subsp. europaea]
MDFEYLVPKNERLRAHISQRSNLRYVKTVFEHFDDRQRMDFCNSCLWFLSEVQDLQFSAQLIQQLVFRCIRTEKACEIWFKVQGHLARFGLQEYALVTNLMCGPLPGDAAMDRVLSRLSHCHADLGIRDNARNRGSICSAIGSSIPTASELDVYQTAAATDLHVSVTLRHIEAELGQLYISTLLLFEDRTVPALDDVARDIIPSQLHSEPLASGGNVGNSRGECALVSSGGGSGDDEESGDSDDQGAGEETGGNKSGNDNGKASDEGDSGDNEDDHTRTPQTGTYSTPPMHRSTSPGHAPSTSYVRQGSLLHGMCTTLSKRGICDLDENGGKTDPVPKCVEPQVHGRGFSTLPVDHDEDMDKEMQERNDGAGMEFEPTMNDDDDEVASHGSGKREDDRVASPTGVAEAEGKWMRHEFRTSGSGNRQDKPIASASGVAEVDGK